MAGKTLDEIIKSKDEARRRVTEAMKSAAAGKKIDPDAAVKELERMIAQQDERIEATKAAMASCASRFEAEIELRKARIAELKDFQARFEKGGDRPAGGIKLQDIRGIGPVAEERLIENGIVSVRLLSQSSPAKIAEILEVNTSKATEFVNEAKRLMRSR